MCTTQLISPQYLLVRPYPSLRITFTSPALRIPGLLQSKFLDRIGGPQHIREGILSAFSSGVGVTAKISWLTAPTTPGAPSHAAHPSDPLRTATPASRPTSSMQGQTNGGNTVGMEGKPRWIHCTPLLGSDDKVGVWMVVMVEQEVITGHLNVQSSALAPVARPAGANYSSMTAQARHGGAPPSDGVASPRFTGGKLYKEYLAREGRQDSMLQQAAPVLPMPSFGAHSHTQSPRASLAQSPPQSTRAPGIASSPHIRDGQYAPASPQIAQLAYQHTQSQAQAQTPGQAQAQQPSRSQPGSQRSRASLGSTQQGYTLSGDRVGNGGGSRQTPQAVSVVAQRAAAGEESFRDF